MDKVKGKSLIHLHILIFSVLIIVLAIAVVVFSKFDHNIKSFELKNSAMGTDVQQTVYGENGEDIASETFLQIKKLEDSISWKNPDSEIFKINKYSGQKWVNVSEKVLNILKTCLDVANKTEGAFDPTCLPFETLWDFSQDGFSAPTNEKIAKVKQSVNYKDLKINSDVKRVKIFNSRSSISLDSVSHGLACDKAIQVYQKMGASSGIIAVGKSVGVYGKKDSGKPWNVAIHDPMKLPDEIFNFAVIKVKSGCVSTCSKLDDVFTNGDCSYNGIIDPRTGHPVKNDIISVTVVHERGLISDMLSRVCSVLGKDDSSYILDYYGAGAVFVDENKNVYVSEKLKKDVVLNNKNYRFK